MIWDEIYLALTLVVLFGAWARNPVAFDCAVGLLVWTVLVQATYRYGEIETLSTSLIGLGMCLLWFLLTFRHRHWLPWYLMSATVVMMAWSALYSGTDAYLYKAVKNGVYVTELVAVVVSYRGAP